MNSGIEELRKYVDEFEERIHREGFRESVIRQLYDDKKIMPLGLVEYDMPYVTLTISIEDFERHIRWVGIKPNWDLNWGHTLYCIVAKINREEGIVECEFQSEAECYNKPKFNPILYRHHIYKV